MRNSSSWGGRSGNDGHVWTQFEIRALYGLMVKGAHITHFDPTKSRSRLNQYIDLSTALNKALHNGDLSQDIPVEEVEKKVKQIMSENKGAMDVLENNKSGHLTRRMVKRFERKLNFTGSLQEWNEGRKKEEAAKPKSFFNKNSAGANREIQGTSTTNANASVWDNTAPATGGEGASNPRAAIDSNGGVTTSTDDAWANDVSNIASGNSGWGGSGVSPPTAASKDSFGTSNNHSASSAQAADAWGSGVSNTVTLSSWDTPTLAVGDFGASNHQSGSNIPAADAAQTTDAWGSIASVANDADVSGWGMVETDAVETAAGVNDPWSSANQLSTNKTQNSGWGKTDEVSAGGANFRVNERSDPWGTTNHSTSVRGGGSTIDSRVVGWGGADEENDLARSGDGSWDNPTSPVNSDIASAWDAGNKDWGGATVSDFTNFASNIVREANKSTVTTSTGQASRAHPSPAISSRNIHETNINASSMDSTERQEGFDWNDKNHTMVSAHGLKTAGWPSIVDSQESLQLESLAIAPRSDFTANRFNTTSYAGHNSANRQEQRQFESLSPVRSTANPRLGFMANNSSVGSHAGFNPERLRRLEERGSYSPEPETSGRNRTTSNTSNPTFRGANADPLPFNRLARASGSRDSPRPGILGLAPIHSVERPWLSDNNKENVDPAADDGWGGGAATGWGEDAADGETGNTNTLAENDGWGAWGGA